MKVSRSITMLKIYIGIWGNASRDIRELSLCQEMGLNTIVMSKAKTNEGPKTEYIDGFEVRMLSSRPLGDWLPISISRLLSVITWAYYVRKLKPDIISGHDLAGLAIGWLYSIFFSGPRKPRLIYDSHEFELGRDSGRTRLELWLLRHLEHFLIQRCAFSIVVSESIADEMQRIHKLKKRPTVVRNTPPKWALANEEIQQTKAMFFKLLGVSSTSFIMMYHGNVTENRGIEKMLWVLSQTENTVAVILGNDEEGYIKILSETAQRMKVLHRVLFLPAVPSKELYKYIGAADVGMIVHPLAGRMNHQYMLPNKLFENIQALTPVICSDFKELGRLVRTYDIGLPVNSENMKAVVNAVERMRSDKALYLHFKRNLQRAKEDLCWEKEKNILQSEYRRVICEVRDDEA